MLDIYALNKAIYGKFISDSNLEALLGTDEYTNNVGFDYVPESVSKPYVRFSIVTDKVSGIYGNKHLNALQMQFSTFAETQSTASAVTKAIGISFHGNPLTLSSGTLVSGKIVDGINMLVDRSDPKVLVYHGIVVIQFTVQS